MVKNDGTLKPPNGWLDPKFVLDDPLAFGMAYLLKYSHNLT
jgi:hypothetical protein